MAQIGSVNHDLIRFRGRGGRVVELAPHHITGIGLSHVRHNLIGWLLAVIGGLALMGCLWVLARYSEVKLGQLLFGMAATPIGVLLILGRFRVDIFTSDGRVHSASVPYWERDQAKLYAEAVRAVLTEASLGQGHPPGR